MSLFEAIALGIVQGLTEFLPVSSSGHLVLAQSLLGIRLPGATFEVTVHLGTLCAVVWIYRARIGDLATGVVRGDRESLRYAGLLALASLPAAAAGLGGRALFEPLFERPLLAASMLLVSGGLAWSLKVTAARARKDPPAAGDALGIGVAQAVAIIPGISRSGATVAVGAGLGVEVVRMAEFSFLLSIPAIAGASILILGEAEIATISEAGALGAGFAAAAISGIAAIRWFIAMLRHETFHRFAYYCWAAGIGYLVAAAFVPALRG